VAKPELGNKRQCQSCGAKFFDLNRDPIVCPKCGTTVEWSTSNRFRPFCSERCRLIDLGAWASEDYRVPDVVKPMDESGE
jgi:uncharacterized protein (TIGR02300 family)